MRFGAVAHEVQSLNIAFNPPLAIVNALEVIVGGVVKDEHPSNIPIKDSCGMFVEFKCMFETSVSEEQFVNIRAQHHPVAIEEMVIDGAFVRFVQPLNIRVIDESPSSIPPLGKLGAVRRVVIFINNDEKNGRVISVILPTPSAIVIMLPLALTFFVDEKVYLLLPL